MLQVIDLSKEFPTPGGRLTVLSEINLALSPGESASIVGPSGSGKSTLLHIVGALEPPTSGSVILSGSNPFLLDERGLAAFRNKEIGFVFQDHHLLPQLSVLENVLVPTLVADDGELNAEKYAHELLERVGLSQRLHHRPSELSGGERQRVALARALVRKPKLLLCDEPTGNLDRAATEAVASLLLELHRNESTILVVVTHNLELANRFSRKFYLSENKLRTEKS
jgi:lipoprotein-releasing system ATP-binding protein